MSFPPRVRLQVLILDDDEEAAWVMREMMVLRHHVARVVHDLVAAWREITTSTPDVLVADYHIGPLKSGALLQTVHDRYPCVRLVLVSGAHRGEWAHLLERGLVDAALNKPFEPLELMQLVEG
jgi:DNA-binding NtrC family response regulator